MVRRKAVLLVVVRTGQRAGVFRKQIQADLERPSDRVSDDVQRNAELKKQAPEPGLPIAVMKISAGTPL